MPRSRHPKKEIEAALQYAEQHGWAVTQKQPKTSHAWRRVTSPDKQVKIRVDGTPKNPGDRAKDIRRAVERYEKSHD